MRWSCWQSVCLGAALLVGNLALVAPAPLPKCDTSAAYREEVYAKALKDLGDSGEYTVIPGVLHFAAFAQPVGRYGLLKFNGLANPPVLCALTANVSSPYGSGLCDFTYAMGPRDAVVALICTPPPVKYFSLRSYSIFRFSPTAWLPAAELADPINNLNIKTTSATTTEGDSFEKTALIISTGDGYTARDMHRAFTEAGFPESAMNLDVVSSNRADFRDRSRTWVRDRSDAIGLLYRVSEFVDHEAVEEYLQVEWPVYFLRAKKRHMRAPAEPLDMPPLRPRGTGETEDFLVEPLNELIDNIRADMQDKYGATVVSSFKMRHVIPDIDRCLTDPTYSPIANDVEAWNLTKIPTCGFFTRDSLYTWMADDNNYADLLMPENRTYVIAGVNQVAMGKCEYSNLLVTNYKYPQSPEHTVNYSAPALVGSALDYLPNRPEEAQFLFAVKLARSCPKDDKFCTEVSESQLGYDEFLYIVERKYLQAATKIGPAPEEVLVPVVLAFESSGDANAAVSSSSSHQGPLVEEEPENTNDGIIMPAR